MKESRSAISIRTNPPLRTKRNAPDFIRLRTVLGEQLSTTAACATVNIRG